MKEEEIDLLLSKYFSGETSPEEENIILNWKKESEKNTAFFDEAKNVFGKIEEIKEQFSVNTEAAWNKLDARLSKPETKIISFYSRKRFLQAAASIFLLITLGFLLQQIFSTSASKPLEYIATNTKIQAKLPDGSEFVLEKNSHITYVEDSKYERKVRLNGSAHFKVVHNAEKNFVIEVGDVFIKDIGTAFYVKELAENNLVEVSVDEGEVQFYTTKNEGLRLVKNEKASFNKLTKEFIRLSPTASTNTMNHLIQNLTFNNSTLSDVVEEINKVYACKVQLENENIGACRLSVNFHNEKLDVLLSVIAETLDLKIKKQQDSLIILSGKPCTE